MKRTIWSLKNKVTDWKNSEVTPFTAGMVVSCSVLTAAKFGYNESQREHISEDDRLERMRAEMIFGGLFGSIIGFFWPISIPIVSTTVAAYLITEFATRKN